MISIIIPAYNAEETIEKAVISLTRQSYSNIEIVIVDDGSTDKTYEKCKKLQQRDNRIKVIQVTNGGPAEARNIGIRKSSGEYIGFLDADDYVEQNMYEILYAAIRDTGVRVAFCNYYIEDFLGNLKENNCEEYVSRQWESKEIHSSIMKAMLGKRNETSNQKILLGTVWRGLYSKELWNKENRWFDKEFDFGEDMIWLLEVLKKENRIVSVEDKLYHYVINERSLTNGKRGYREEFWLKRKRLNDRIEYVVQDCIDEKELEECIDWRYRSNTLESVCTLFEDSSISVKDKDLKKIIDDKRVEKAFSDYPRLKPLQRYLYYCIKKKKIKGLQFYYKLRSYIK